MTTEKLLLQSGFISDMNPDMARIPPRARGLAEFLASRSIYREDTTHYYDSRIDEIYGTMSSQVSSIGNFDFRHRVLVKTAQLFGKNWVNWMKLQKQSPCYTYLHDRFLLETLKFVFNNEPRKLSVSQYIRMLDTEDDNLIYQATQALPSEHTLEQLLDTFSNAETHRLLMNWTETTEKIVDLVLSLVVMFGKRGPKTVV